jgi:uncharacterized protein YecE (DUF72 family)
MGRCFIGTSGFAYDDWEGVFYPEGLPKRQWLKYYSEVFSTVELNVTFYRLPRAETFKKWNDETPEGFSFSLKGSRFITHIKRLLEPQEPIQRFIDASKPLRAKTSVVLWQFPPGFGVDMERLRNFLSLLKPFGLRHCFEFRNETWLREDVFSLLSKAGASACMADWPPFIDELPVISDFVYIRRHGKGGSYATSYTDEELREDARRIRKYLKKGLDVYIYFNNDFSGYAPKNALTLKRLLKCPSPNS